MSWQTRVQIFNSVPFDLRNNHTRWFDNKAQQESYFNNLGGTLTKTQNRYVKIEEKYIDVEAYADNIDNVNYAIIDNTNSQLNAQRKYYVFVTKVEFINTNVTRLHFEVDVLQTYMFDLNFRQSYVERQHLNSANRVSENLDLGVDYINISSTLHRKPIDHHFKTMVVITSKDMADLDAKTGGKTTNILSPLNYYLMLVPRGVATIKFNDVYIQTQASNNWVQPRTLFDAFYDDDFANTIVGVSYLPVFPYAVDSFNVVEGSVVNEYTITSTQMYPSKFIHNDYYVMRLQEYHVNPIDYINQNVKSIITTYMNNNGITEPKLRQYPFARVVLRDNLGSQLEIKPQYLDGNNLQVEILPSISSVPKVAYRVKNYETGKNMTNALVSSVNADVEVINDYTATYLQGRKNADLSARNWGIAGNLLKGAGGVAIAGVSGFMGNPMGMAAGGSMVAGSLINTFSGISQHNAKYEDMERIPPTLESQAGASNIMIGYDYSYPQVDIEVADLEYLKRANSYMKQFGYAVKDVTDINLKTRTRYNFIKTIGCNVTGKVPQIHLDKVRSIFDAGVTLWHTNDMYNYQPANNVR